MTISPEHSPTPFEKAYRRMLTEFGAPYVFQGTQVPTHYNTQGLSKSVDWETGIILKNFVEFYAPQVIVELGTFRGYSTSWLILGSLLAEIRHKYFGEVHAYEVFNEGEYGRMWYDEFELPKECFRYHAVPGGIWNYPAQVPDKIDFIFHDTQHLLEPTKKEMDLLLPRLSVGGFLLVDDMLYPDYVPMRGYFHEFFSGNSSYEWSVLPLGHGLGIARKIQ